ncbi:Rhodanese-like sulphurtransferase [Nitrospira japonica]|uniref:Rhodanese-like sulphurtransferase n=1 Tax=Nitrospira japonica TaxID=1325564 RepID=A0A1W1I3B7_9BACT|nr:rhodanese-like domain-containing protein [Nitrospira japonica]SLM47465.1 Rhodanese-like sulphurtransferase [Nitrospira japonica]
MRTRLATCMAWTVAVFVLTIGTVSADHSYLLTVQQLRAGLNKAGSPDRKGFVLIDVRSPEEHAGGYIPGTDFNIDFREIKARHRELGADYGDHIVVYCQSGRRSGIAAEALADLGYTRVYNVSGSMNAWMEAGYPIASAGR